MSLWDQTWSRFKTQRAVGSLHNSSAVIAQADLLAGRLVLYTVGVTVVFSSPTSLAWHLQG